MKYFSDLGLIPALERVLAERKFDTPTEIQQKAIPVLLENPVDLIGLAQTGTGKTAAFGLPLLQHIDFNKKGTQGIVLCPTREIAIQTFKELTQFSKYLGKIKMENVYGGTSVNEQIKNVKRNVPHIIVGTPGRVIDLLKRKAINLSEVEYFILDEADEMLNMGFEQDIQTILEFASDDAKTWLFSATMPPSIKKIVHKYMDQPVEVNVMSNNMVNEQITHQFAIIQKSNKYDKLKFIIDHAEGFYGVIFCRMKSETEELAQNLRRDGYEADAINGDLNQAKRERVVKGFKSKKSTILVASDVAARGLDVKNLTHVIHYALPDTFEYYTHRSGRTGRAGETGLSIAFISKAETKKLKQFEKALKIHFEEYYIDLRPPSLEKQIEKWMDKNHPSRFHTDKEALEMFSESIKSWTREDLLKVILHSEFKYSKKESEKKETEKRAEEYHDRRDRSDSKSSKKKKDKKSKVLVSTPENKGQYTNIFINVGYSDGFKPNTLATFIADHGINPNQIGNIEVFKRHSIFALENGLAQHASFVFKDIVLKGRKIIARVDRN